MTPVLGIFNPSESLFYTSTQSDWPPLSAEKNHFVSITLSSRDTKTYCQRTLNWLHLRFVILWLKMSDFKCSKFSKMIYNSIIFVPYLEIESIEFDQNSVKTWQQLTSLWFPAAVCTCSKVQNSGKVQNYIFLLAIYAFNFLKKGRWLLETSKSRRKWQLLQTLLKCYTNYRSNYFRE